ncbi:hypothetical protein D3C85_1492640 [compost metagenome]
MLGALVLLPALAHFLLPDNRKAMESLPMVDATTEQHVDIGLGTKAARVVCEGYFEKVRSQVTLP